MVLRIEFKCTKCGRFINNHYTYVLKKIKNNLYESLRFKCRYCGNNTFKKFVNVNTNDLHIFKE